MRFAKKTIPTPVGRHSGQYKLSDEKDKSAEAERRRVPADQPADETTAASSAANETVTARSAEIVRRVMGRSASRL